MRVSSGSPTGPPKSAKTDIENKENEVSEAETGQVETVGQKWKEKSEAAQLVGEATISPTKEEEGLMKKPDVGAFMSVV